MARDCVYIKRNINDKFEYLSSKYLSFLEKNHIKHHRSKGTKYFNITLPIADYIFGTY